MNSTDASSFEPVDIYQIDTIEKLRVIANPLRMQILDCLIPKARTVKEVGTLLNIQSNTRYYHVSALEEAGMITVVDTVINSGIQQKYYRATGKYFQLEPSLLHSNGQPAASDSAASFLAGALETGARDLRQSFKAGLAGEARDITRVSRRTITTSRAQAAEFRQRLADLEKEFQSLHQEDGETAVELAYGFFPNARPRDDHKRADSRSPG